jgi:hypothetical protein
MIQGRMMLNIDGDADLPGMAMLLSPDSVAPMRHYWTN